MPNFEHLSRQVHECCVQERGHSLRLSEDKTSDEAETDSGLCVSHTLWIKE